MQIARIIILKQIWRNFLSAKCASISTCDRYPRVISGSRAMSQMPDTPGGEPTRTVYIGESPSYVDAHAVLVQFLLFFPLRCPQSALSKMLATISKSGVVLGPRRELENPLTDAICTTTVFSQHNWPPPFWSDSENEHTHLAQLFF